MAGTMLSNGYHVLYIYILQATSVLPLLVPHHRNDGYHVYVHVAKSIV